MKIAEIRDLDGPNLFMLRPAIKLELDAGGDAPMVAEAFAASFAIGAIAEPMVPVPVSTDRLLTLLTETVNVLHDRSGVQRPQTATRVMETPHHLAVAFGWSHRDFAKLLAVTTFEIVAGTIGNLDARLGELASLAVSDATSDQQPEMLADEVRSVPIIGITGTNGKTTTTRLIASILMESGKRVGWTSSSGVVIQGETVLEGDFTGPAGASRVFEEPGLDVAVLETARGGILLRGLGYESNDVSVVTNISADHLGLQGVHTVEELANVKKVVALVTRPEGFVVLNAGDPLVLAMRESIQGRPFLISRVDDNPDLIAHCKQGGWSLWVEHGEVHFSHDGAEVVLTDLNDIPITFGGKAHHMLENALCAAAATLAIGLSVDQVRTGLSKFRNVVEQNKGRLNVFDVNGATIVVDFAHNAAGLRYLLMLGRGLVVGDGKLVAVVGSAGDRPDDALVEMGRLAGAQADIVIAKDTVKYLRGRQPGDILSLLLQGVGDARRENVLTAANEYAAFEQSLSLAGPGDVVVIMCIEDVNAIIDHLSEIGTPVS
jgi:cyanophycin synthetase